MQVTDRSDKELVESYLNGNQSSFEFLLQRHQSRVFAYIMMLVKDRQLADDIFQDTFIKVIRTLKSGAYQEEGKFIQWVMRIAHNLIIDHFRKSKRLPVSDNGTDDYQLVDRLEYTDISIEQKLITEQIHDDLRKMIEFLPPEQKEVLHLRLYAEMSFKDIAEATDVSINTALGRMRYALINMRKMIREKNVSLTY
ncbi:MAG: sigma-70 family RNA polymerase sigma factor [Bacteroidales bacterium]|jgi:RNA polymerase sigma-70 factor (ECF subfamily)|nr:sigma-70 family RNA polymerase sigma factor [Bacteroidales bacterium]MCK9447580.1 sigma-70 family RNA polymerase sigma factor [Bacteroidales bacterium]MDD3701503.1 sigma-70 family RNA polymerase sigma factor [Bacteroidales bacterium]MDY0369230.1 sigma-70 family RNA polymerase sigma factor [Bacteroidales bacterium]